MTMRARKITRQVRVQRRTWQRLLAAAALLMALSVGLPGVLRASPAEVVRAVFERQGDAWHVSVTLRHADSGWDHYANLWIVETLDGRELGRRVLLHPHETEQPFTRSGRIAVPAHVTRVRIRAGDNVHGLYGGGLVVDLTRPRGDRYEVR